MLASAAASALAALAVTVAAPAIGDERPPDVDDFVACLREHGLPDAPSGAALKPWLGERLEREDKDAVRAMDECSPVTVVQPPDERELRVCLVDHGAQIDGNGKVAIKRWLREHADDPAARDAMKACHIAHGDAPKIACDGEGDPHLRTPGAQPDEPAPPTTETTPREL